MMTMVVLEDGTTYYVDSPEAGLARYAVDYKLRNRSDYRKIQSSIVYEELSIDKDSPYYNSANPYNNVPLKAKTGWSYKWSDHKTAEFR